MSNVTVGHNWLCLLYTESTPAAAGQIFNIKLCEFVCFLCVFFPSIFHKRPQSDEELGSPPCYCVTQQLSVTGHTSQIRSWDVSSTFMLKWYLLRSANKQTTKKKKRSSHGARSTEMLALSSARVNSLLGPLAQWGVQGCLEINQQLTSSHHSRSRFHRRPSPDRLGGSAGGGMINPQ